MEGVLKETLREMLASVSVPAVFTRSRSHGNQRWGPGNEECQQCFPSQSARNWGEKITPGWTRGIPRFQPVAQRRGEVSSDGLVVAAAGAIYRTVHFRVADPVLGMENAEVGQRWTRTPPRLIRSSRVRRDQQLQYRWRPR